MADSQTAKHTPLSNDPVGAIVGEFIQEKEREIKEEKARRAPAKRSPVVIPFLLVLCLAVWIAPSLMPPASGETVEPAVLERGARLNLYLASLRIRQYQALHRTLPANLLQVGVDTTGVTYTRRNDTFELATSTPGSMVIYRSTQPDSVFLGADRIRGIR